MDCGGAAMHEDLRAQSDAGSDGAFETGPLGAVEVRERSTVPNVTEANICYRLGGAKYGIFANEACTNAVQTVTTGADGRARSAATLAPGRYWVLELEASEGFAPGKHAVTVELTEERCRTGESPVALVEQAPRLASASVLVARTDRDTGDDAPLGDASLAGALFSIEHYAGCFDSIEEIAAAGVRPTRSWSVVTDERGRATADDLFSDERGEVGLPLGTMVVREVRPSVGYLPPDPSVFVRPINVAPDSTGGAVYDAPVVAEQVVRGDVALRKLGKTKDGPDGGDAGAVPLENVSFDIVLASSGEVAARIVTDADGRASTAALHGGALDGALPYGVYEVREDPATTPPGYRAAEPFAVAVDENGRTSFYEVENERVGVPEASAEAAAPGAALAETGDPLGLAPRCTALAAVLSATLAAAVALRRQRP